MFADEKRMEKERGGEKERQTSALESMRMSEGSERRRMAEKEEESGGAGARETENRRRGRRRYVAAEGGSERAGWLRSTGARERSGSAREPITRGGSRGVHEGPGYSAHARRAWERALTFRQCPLFLFRSIRPALLRVPSLLLSPSRTTAAPLFFPRARVARVLSLQGPIRLSLLSLSLSLSLPVSHCWRLGEDPRSRPSAHDPRPRGHGVIRSGVLNIWVIVNANREWTVPVARRNRRASIRG